MGFVSVLMDFYHRNKKCSIFMPHEHYSFRLILICLDCNEKENKFSSPESGHT